MLFAYSTIIHLLLARAGYCDRNIEERLQKDQSTISHSLLIKEARGAVFIMLVVIEHAHVLHTTSSLEQGV